MRRRPTAASTVRALSIEVLAKISTTPINGDQQQADFRLRAQSRSLFVLRGAEMHFRSGHGFTPRATGSLDRATGCVALESRSPPARASPLLEPRQQVP